MPTRRTILVLALGLALLAPASASALALATKATRGITATAAKAAPTSQTVTSHGLTVTLSYPNGPGIETTSETLTIGQAGEPTYKQPVPSKGCFKVCSPASQRAVHVVEFNGYKYPVVVLGLFTGGADCCSIVDVYVQSAAIPGDWIPATRNFGEDGTELKDVGPHGWPEFVSGDPAFYCQFSACYASGLPLQVFSFSEDAFHNVTKHYPKLIAADADKWIKLYYKDPAQGLGLIAAWAADEDNLGLQATVRTVLQLQTADGHLKPSFVTSLQRFLNKHGYDG